MTKVYTCRHCGVVTRVREQVCEPREAEDKGAYCGTSPERGTLCPEVREHLPYVCKSCGRPAEQGDLLCDPLLTGSD